jgi:hypothetical protein
MLANIGISTSAFGDNEALVVVDVDNSKDKQGDQELLKLELAGFDFPETYTQITPNGGRHLVYRCSVAVKQGTSVLAPGIDIRSHGGYIVGKGSRLAAEHSFYRSKMEDVARAPQWLLDKCGAPKVKPTLSSVSLPTVQIDSSRSTTRGKTYLTDEAPLALQGNAGDQTTFVVACRLKDLGCTEGEAFNLMADYWNRRCEPAWPLGELKAKVQNAFRYGVEPRGVSAPEIEFSPVVSEVNSPTPPKGHPFEELNKEYAFVLAGGGHHIIWETKDQYGNPRVEHLNTQTFHQNLAPHTMAVDGKARPVSELWIRDKSRRSYDGICFMPGREAPKRFYNLWRGFSVEPIQKGETPSFEAKAALDAFLEHIEQNICRGDKKLTRWVTGFFAHLVQRPWEKPLVALVLRGRKGTGKNVLVDTVGHLLGAHYTLAADRRYLVGNFNGHLENCLMMALDEAFWSGDKQAEGQLKNLVTGTHHVIEHKGKETYRVENCTRVCILGNEEWLVPASQDERRFAVLDVGDGRFQDRVFFSRLVKGMKSGGSALLLRHLLDYDLTGIDLNDAPKTKALLDQKLASLDPFYQWWLDTLNEGRLPGSEFDESEEWPEQVDKAVFRDAYIKYARSRNVRTRVPEALGKLLKNCVPSVVANQKRKTNDRTVHVYRFPPLAQARREWEEFIGHMTQWD